MDGLSELTAAPVTWTIGGRQYRVAPLRARDYGEMERQVLAARPDPLELVKTKLAGLPERLQERLLIAAYEDARKGARVSAGELAEWMGTIPGRIFQFWLGLRQNHPELTLEAAGELLRQAGEEREANATNTPPG
ncbi:MAG: hypothetical protein ACYC35_23900, partial [Pirellulales bacterium]